VPENELSSEDLRFEREYDLPPAIVWDALTDEDLVEGWLAAAKINPRMGGQYWLNWQTGSSLAPTNGVITVIQQSRRLRIETDNIGTLDFTLEAIPGGTRGDATVVELRLNVDTDRRLLASTVAHWETNFDQLEDLLRGHPVDWSTWQRDRGEAWESYRRASAAGD